MDLSIQTSTFTQGDQSWLGSAHGTDFGDPCTLDKSAFTVGTHYPDGFFKSGLPLGKITASGKYGPYGANTSEGQTVTITGTPTGGTVTLTFDGETTGTIAYNASAATVQTALEALSNLNAGDVVVTGGPGPGTAWVVTFAGARAGTNLPQMTAAGGSLTGGSSPAIAVTTTTAGGAAVSDGTETLVGFLFCAVDVATTDVDPVGTILRRCNVIESKLPVAVDVSGKADVAGAIIFE